MVDDASGNDAVQMWAAVERLNASSQATRDSLDAVRNEQSVTISRMNSIEREQVSINTRLDAIEREQITTNAHLNSIEKEQIAMNTRLDAMSGRIDKLFYAIAGGSITVTAAVIIHGILAG